MATLNEAPKNITYLMRYRYYALFILLLLITLCGIFDHDFISYGELRESEIGREFLDSNHSWAVPTLNNEPFMEKPPLVYWTIAGSLKILGIHDWAARIPCIFFGWGVLLFTYLLAKDLYGKGVGIGSVLVLATNIGFIIRSHEILPDNGLFFFVSGGAYFLYRAFTGSKKWYILSYLFALGAFFSKGFIGFGFLGLLFLAWIILNKKPKEVVRARPWVWIPLMSIPIVVWFIELANDPRGKLLYIFLVHNNLWRFLPTSEYYGGHTQPFWYTFIRIVGQFLPWILVLCIAIPWLWSQRKDRAMKFLICWFASGFLLLTVAGTKRGIYMAPLLPPLAVMVAVWFYEKARKHWLISSATIMAVLFVIFCIVGVPEGIPVPKQNQFFFVIPKSEQKKSLRAFYKKLSSMMKPTTKLYGFKPTEVTLAAIPLYTGRYFSPIGLESDLNAMSRQYNQEIVIIASMDRYDDKDFKTVNKYFKYIWLKQNVASDRMIWALSNVPNENR